MAKILINQDLYDQVSDRTFYEAEYEKIIEKCAGILFPDFYFLPFKATVQSENNTAKPDYALIDKKYRDWWVVEIEMAYHSLENHVIPQVQTLSNASYSKKEAEILAKNSALLEYQKVLDMLKGKQPNVIVIVNATLPTWIEKLNRYNCIVTFFEIFITDRNNFAYKINGQFPQKFKDFLSKCRFEKSIPNFLKVQSPAGLGISHGEELKIYYLNEFTYWRRLDTGDSVWLVPRGKNPLKATNEYKLFTQDDGSLIFEENV